MLFFCSMLCADTTPILCPKTAFPVRRACVLLIKDGALWLKISFFLLTLRLISR